MFSFGPTTAAAAQPPISPSSTPGTTEQLGNSRYVNSLQLFLLLYTIIIKIACSTGRETPQYKAVLHLFEAIVQAIKATPSVKESLSIKFITAEWIDTTTQCTEKELVQCALGKIEQESSKFQTFVRMLRETTGMDTIAKMVKQKETDYSC